MSLLVLSFFMQAYNQGALQRKAGAPYQASPGNSVNASAPDQTTSLNDALKEIVTQEGLTTRKILEPSHASPEMQSQFNATLRGMQCGIYPCGN